MKMIVVSRPILASLPKFGPKIFFRKKNLKTIIVCKFKDNKWIKIEKIAKKLVLDPIFAHLAEIWAAWYHGQLSSCIISRKTNDPVFEQLSDERTDGRADGQTERQTRVISCDSVNSRRASNNEHKIMLYS